MANQIDDSVCPRLWHVSDHATANTMTPGEHALVFDLHSIPVGLHMLCV